MTPWPLTRLLILPAVVSLEQMHALHRSLVQGLATDAAMESGMDGRMVLAACVTC